MLFLAVRPRTIFLGQAVAYKGTGMTETFAVVPREQLLELPVFENTQLGMSIGLAVSGWTPVSIFPRWNFLLAAADQLVNHLDKLPIYSAFTPKVIIRTASATSLPLDPGPQHLGDFAPAFRAMFKTVNVVQLLDGRKIVHEYRAAACAQNSTILVEYPDRYDDPV